MRYCRAEVNIHTQASHPSPVLHQQLLLVLLVLHAGAAAPAFGTGRTDVAAAVVAVAGAPHFDVLWKHHHQFFEGVRVFRVSYTPHCCIHLL